MNTGRLSSIALCAGALVSLAGCGGGGGFSSGSDTAVTYPTSGPYAWILKAAGPTSALRYGLSLVHTAKPDTEYVVEAASSVVTDGRLVTSGTVDQIGLRANSLQPAYLVYVVGGDVRSVPMVADGSAPGARVQRAGSTSACRFMIDAIDYASPQSSRFIVSTAGADGICNTADDGRAEVRLSPTLGVTVTPIAGEPPFDVVRDPVTLAPRGWLYSRTISLWSTTPATTFQTRAPTDPAVTAVVASTYNSALVEDGRKLAVFDFSGAMAVTESDLDGTVTAGTGWQSIGFDAGNFYVYRNAGTGFTSTYSVLRVSRSAPTATVLTTGTGLVSLAAMGSGVVYLTVFGTADNRLIRVNKTGNATPVVTSTAIDTLISMQTSAAGVHQAWRVTGVGSAQPTYTIDMVDETGASLFNAAGGFPIGTIEAGSKNFNSSESRSGFLLATGYGARAFGDASLVSYDATGRTARTIGAFPGTATYGSDFVFANAIGGPTSQGLAFAARSSGGSVQEAGAKVFSFDVNTANSLLATTVVR